MPATAATTTHRQPVEISPAAQDQATGATGSLISNHPPVPTSPPSSAAVVVTATAAQEHVRIRECSTPSRAGWQ